MIPPPPNEPQPDGGTREWGAWHMRHTFTPDTAVMVEWLAMVRPTHVRRQEYALACHRLKWPGWQANLVWAVLEAITAPLRPAWTPGGADADGEYDDDIPF